MKPLHVKAYTRLSRIYDLGWDEMATRYVPFLLRLLRRVNGRPASVLDVACETGTLAIALARAGHVVHGVDSSSEMIAVARTKASGLARASFDVADMRRLVEDGAFDLITCTFDSVNYLAARDDLRAMFLGVARCLAPRARFVFDSNTEAHYATRAPFSRRCTWGGHAVLHELQYGVSPREATILFRFEDGSVETHRQHPYDMGDLRPVLAESGLVVQKTYSDPEGHEMLSGSDRVVCVVRHSGVAPD